MMIRLLRNVGLATYKDRILTERITPWIVYGIIQIMEKLFLLKFLNWNKIKIINFIYTFVISIVLFIVFRSDNIFDAITIFKQYFIMESRYNILTYINMKYIIVLIFGILFMGLIQRPLYKVYDKIKKVTVVNVIDALIQLSILAYAILSVVDGTYNPFIYFQF